MKKVFNSFYVLMLLFLSSCASNENVDTTTKGTSGTLVTKINFSQAQGTRATSNAESTAIPITSWSNVKDLQLFLYKEDGTVAFSAIFTPSDGTTSGTEKTFTWTNVPKGTYKLALVANIHSGDIRTTLDGSNWDSALTSYNVIGKSLTTTPGIYADLKTTAFPAQYNNVDGKDAAYLPPSEIFTAYSSSSVKIEEGKTNNDLNSSSSALSLKREISLMRVRVDRTNKTEAANLEDKVHFDTEHSFIVVHRLPKGLRLDGTGAFEDSDKDRILIGAKGAGTFEKTDPTSGYNAGGVILSQGYTLWRDIFVLPTKIASTDLTDLANRKYFIIIAGWADQGYVYADNQKVEEQGGKAVYWWGTINGVFSPNVIREVNLSLKSAGYSTHPVDPDETGGLTITVGAPLNWSSNIVSETIEL